MTFKYTLSLPKLTLALLLTLSLHMCHAQDTLIIHNKLEIQALTRAGQPLKFKQLIAAAEAEELPEAAKHFKRARNYNLLGNVIGLPGAFLVGYQLGSALVAPSNFNTGIFVAGIGMVGVQYTLIATTRDPNMRKGIAIYNEALHQKRIKAASE
ncbi:MAG: hypothetical protein MUE96_02790 [Bacteroidia bacterium]|jgi:hypothetical protein|nr:hypothetical protein [Bacteroidia bacterium]